MAQEEHWTPIQVPKLSLDGSNWVVYCDRLKWAMQTNNFDNHAGEDSPLADYLATGTIGSVTTQAQWMKEENTIRLALGSTLLDTTFNRIKATANVHNAWEILKWVFEEWSKALVTDVIQRFRNKRCKEDESVRNHFEYLADLCEQLTAIGKVVTDEDYTDMLLALLPASYDGAVLSISVSARLSTKVLTAEIFEQFMLDESEWHQVKNEHTKVQDEALATDTGSGKGKDWRRDK